MSPKHKQRLYIAILGGVALSFVVALVLNALSQNINLFFTPTDIFEEKVPDKATFRLGGMVVKDSVSRDKGLLVRFKVTDFRNELNVSYQGILPDLFKEGQGIVALGELMGDGCFHATQILAKHDENYMPPQVAQALKNRNV